MNHYTSPYSLLALAMDAGNGTFLDHVGTRPNLRRAVRRVVGNRGAPGVDSMTVCQLAAAWPSLAGQISQQVSEGTYPPSAIRRHAVPKAGGRGVRILGIPTVLDRTVQQAIAQPLGALLEEGFSPHSFGFRPGRSAHDALQQARGFVENGRGWVLHLDLEKFFDLAPHDLVLARLAERVADPRLLALVRRFLTAPFACGVRLEPRSRGLPQGSPLSPLLANLLLDQLDVRLFDAGFSFCRYADDLCLYFTSEPEAREALDMITPWIEGELRLRINREKTRIVPVEEDVVLGYRLVPGSSGVIFTPSREALANLRSAVRGLLNRHRTGNPRELLCDALMPLVRGWTAYFSLTTDSRFFAAVDHLVIFEMRRWLWRRVRDPRRRVRVLVKRGVRAELARRLVAGEFPIRSVIQSAAFRKAYPLEWLKARGWVSCREFPYSMAPASDRCAEEQVGRCDFIASVPDTQIAADSRIAARRCDIYECQGLISLRPNIALS